MWAVVEINKKQYFVQKGDTISVERLKKEGEIELDKVLVFSNADKIEVGTPYISQAKVIAQVKDEIKGKKITIYKYKRRKKYRKKQGHRQILTSLEIKDIIL